MRDYNQVINQILEFANQDDTIRVVIMNGSRVNPKAPKDIMQDYDIVFFIKDSVKANYKKDMSWMQQFGELVIFQQNDTDDGLYIFLMQFKNGIRIDLRFCDINRVKEVIREDTLVKVLLDKDNRLEKLAAPSDEIYWTKKPNKSEWDDLLNELWWIQTYIAKGIWRDELPYVKYMYDVILIDCVRNLLSLYIGEKYKWEINVGKCGKWFKRLLDTDLYNRYVDLYSCTDYNDIWDKLFKIGDFIREIGLELSIKLGYNYPLTDDKNVTEFIKKIKDLPKDATCLMYYQNVPTKFN